MDEINPVNSVSRPPKKRLKQIPLCFTNLPATSKSSNISFAKTSASILDKPVEISISLEKANENASSFGTLTESNKESIFQLPAEPFHPRTEFKFPKTGERSCHANWFNEWKWLHYDVNKNQVFCFMCMSAIHRKLMPAKEKTSETAFTDNGFRNWKNGPQQFRIHEKSAFHSKCGERLLAVNKKGIDSVLSDQLQAEQSLRREGLKSMLSAIIYLGRQGFPLRGHEHNSGAFYNLVIEVTREKPQVQRFFKERDNWLSDTIQNELLELIAHQIQRSIIKEVSTTHYVGLTADGTTDMAGEEQLAICLQYMTEDLKSTNRFLGFYNPPNGKGETLASSILDVLTRFTVPLEKVAGYSFDTAANMSGMHKGVQARLKEKCPQSIYVPCCNHTLDLVLQEAGRFIKDVAETLDFVQSSSNVIRESSSRRNLYATMFGNEEIRQPLSLCPTRWCIRGAALTRAFDNYEVLRKTLTVLSEEGNGRSTSKALLSGLARQVNKAKTYIALEVCAKLFTYYDCVAKILQGNEVTANGALLAVKVLEGDLQRLRNNMNEIIRKTASNAEMLGLQPLLDKRRAKTPAKLSYDESITVTEDEQLPMWSTLDASFKEAIDLMLSTLHEKFDNAGMKLAAERERVIINSIKDSNFIDTVSLEHLQLPPSIDSEKLKRQLHQLQELVDSDELRCKPTTIQHVANILASKDRVVRILFSEVIRLVSLTLCLPCSNASSERAFSNLKRLKTCLRTTVGQGRLTHLAMLSVNDDILNELDRNELLQQFINCTNERRCVFGSFINDI